MNKAGQSQKEVTDFYDNLVYPSRVSDERYSGLIELKKGERRACREREAGFGGRGSKHGGRWVSSGIHHARPGQRPHGFSP